MKKYLFKKLLSRQILRRRYLLVKTAYPIFFGGKSSIFFHVLGSLEDNGIAWEVSLMSCRLQPIRLFDNPSKVYFQHCMLIITSSMSAWRQEIIRWVYAAIYIPGGPKKSGVRFSVRKSPITFLFLHEILSFLT